MISVQEFFESPAPVDLPQHCDEPAPLVGFEAERYQGVWYDQQHTKDVWYLNNEDVCGEVQYTGLTADSHFDVHNTSQPNGFGTRAGIRGEAWCPDTTGQCFVNFGGGYTSKSNYKIVDTDYETYTLVYSCYNAFKPKLWILTRDNVMSEELYGKTRAIIAEKLPKYNAEWDDVMNHTQYQGPLCTYDTDSSAFLQ